MHQRSLLRTFVLTVPTAFGACGAADAPHEPVVISDSAGVRIIESRAPAWQPGQVRVSENVVLSIGVADGPPEYQLFRVTGAVRLADGRIVIANGGTRELKFFDPNGSHLRTTGGAGGGPGEFENLSWLGQAGSDTLLVWDSQARRLSIFHANGNFVSSVTAGQELPGFAVLLRGVFGDGSFVLEPGESPFAFVGRSTGVIRDSITLIRYHRNGSNADTLGRFPGSERFLLQRDGGFSLADVFFGRRTFTAIRGDRLYVADNDRFEISAYDPDGGLRERIRRVHDPAAVERHHLEQAREAALAELGNEAPRRQREQVLAETPSRETFPAFQGFLTDRTGRLWLEEYRPPGDVDSRWSIFDADGRWLGSVHVPAGLRVLEIGEDYLIGVDRDAYDVEYVRVYRIEGSDG